MKVNTNIGLRDRSKVTLKDFRGLDTLSTSVDVNKVHATEMQNLIVRDGVNHKRYGWKTQYRIREDSQFLKIQGIFNFTLFGEDFTIAYAGKRFFLLNPNGEYANITNKAIESITHEIKGDITVAPVQSDLLADDECKFFVNGNKVYFIGCGDYLVFSKWGNGKFELRRVSDNEDVYIPTTTENIRHEGYGEHTRITAEERNLLTPYTYNTLFGPEFGEDEEETATSYVLDATDILDLEIEIEQKDGTKVVLRRNDSALLNNGDVVKAFQSKDNIVVWGEPTVELGYTYLLPLEIDLIKFEDESRLFFKNEYLEKETTKRTDSLGHVIGWEIKPTKLRCSLCYERKGNIILLYTTTPKSFEIQKFAGEWSFGIEYGQVQGDLSEYSPTISENGIVNGKYIGIGEDTFTNNGFKATLSNGVLTFMKVENVPNAYAPRVSDVPNIKVKIKSRRDTLPFTNVKIGSLFGTQGVADRLFIADGTGNTVRWSKDNDFTYFGENSWLVCGTADKEITGMVKANDTSLIIAKKHSLLEPSIFVVNGKFESKESDGFIDYKSIFQPKGYQTGIGAIGQVVNFNGECLLVAKDGLYAITLGENVAVDSRTVVHRSRQISNRLQEFDLSQAKCVSYGGQLFVSVGGNKKECYVADSKYTVSIKGDMQSVVNYEWWRWTNIPANVWGYVNNELWFGTEDGQICTFTKAFNDEVVTTLSGENGLIGYEIENENIVGFKPSGDIATKKGDIFTPTCDFYGAITTDKFRLENGKTYFNLPLNNFQDGETIYIDGNPYEIVKDSQGFSIDYTTTSTEITFYKNYKNQPLTLTKDEMVELKDVWGNSPNWASVGLNPSQNDFKGKLSHKDTVVSRWVTGALDFGTRSYTKTISSILITVEKDLANHLKYGIRTRIGTHNYEHLRANNDLDFSQLDMQTVSLDSQFASSYVRKLNFRNVNFAMLYFSSEMPEDSSLNSVELEFYITKQNIGVR